MSAEANPLPSWPLCTAEAKKLAKELQLDYYDKPERLKILEVLHLLLPKAVLGEGMPEKISSPPWLLGGDGDHKKTNDLLRHSLRAQMGRIPNTEFSSHVVSDDGLAVSGLVQLYLDTIGVKCEMTTGVMQFAKGEDKDGTPAVWLDFEGGQVVDNAYVHFEDERRRMLFFRMRHKDLYVRDLLEGEQKRKLFVPSKGANLEETTKLLRFYGRRYQVEKYILTRFKMSQIKPGLKMFDILMRDFVQRVHGKAVVDLELKWDVHCWSCFEQRDAKALKACSVCKFAKYCDGHCQKKEWKTHKVLHLVMENMINS